MTTRQDRGKLNYQAGLSAEDIVARTCDERGTPIVAKRWRGSRGEIDLVARDGDAIVFIEVKKSKSHTQAVARVTAAQIERIFGAGSEFLATQPKGQLTDIRLDVALVDEFGRVRVIENATM